MSKPPAPMANLAKGSNLYIKFDPKPRRPAKKLGRKDGHAELHAQFASETPSATSLGSETGSSQGATQSTETSRTAHDARRYAITASRHAQAGLGQNSRPILSQSNPSMKFTIVELERPGVIFSRSAKPKKDNKPVVPRAAIEASEQAVPAEAWWNQQTGIDEPPVAPMVEPRQYPGTGSYSPSSPSRIPRPNRNYPPTSYRNPFALPEDGNMHNDLPRLPVKWKPHGYQPPPTKADATAEPAKGMRLRRLSGPPPGNAKRPFPIPPPAQVIPTKHTRGTMSIDIVQMPYSSPEVAAPAAAHSRSRRTSCTSAFSQRTRQSKGAHLPPPEEVYGQAMYFTHCPHTSPPAGRPLDTQPILQVLTSDLLKEPSHIIKARLDLAARSGREKEVYTITGRCPECDWRSRRDAESKALMEVAYRRYDLENRIADLEMQEGEEEPESPPTPEQPTWDPSEKQMDLQLSILMLESDLEELDAQQDGEVKKIWKGFAARWGPGAVGIEKEMNDEDSDGGSRVESRATADSSGTGSSVDNVHAEGRMKLDWIRPETRKH